MNVTSTNHAHMEMAHSTHLTNTPVPPPSVPTPTVSSQPAPRRAQDISQPVKDYVLRAFNAESKYPGITTDEVSAKMNVVITQILHNGKEFSTDWSTLALPQELIMQERSLAAPTLAPTPAPARTPNQPVYNSWIAQPQQHNTYPLPPHLPPPPPHAPPPHTNVLSTTHSSHFVPTTRQSPSDEEDDRTNKRRHNEERDPSPHKRLRARSPDRRSRNNNNRDTWDRYNGTRSSDSTPSPPTDKYERGLDQRISKTSNKHRKNEEDRKYTRQQERRKQEEKQNKKQKQTEFEKRHREDELIKRKERLMRFADSKAPIQTDSMVQTKSNTSTNPYGRLVGINTDLEKDYYRLTSDPKPELVRPQAVLEKSLVLVQQKWAKDRKYNYVKSQLKSIRQDLVVQHIKNPFTIEVYKVHARIALEMSDLGEYNQCQTQLHTLYKTMRKRLPTEFIAYRILYFILTKNGPAMTDVVLEINEDERKDAAVKNALDIRSAIALGNYYRFFRLCRDVPNLGSHLVQFFMVRQRLAALANYAKTFKHRPELKLNFFTDEMFFDTVEEGVQFFNECITPYGDATTFFQSINGEQMILLHNAATILRQAADAAARTIDIKGQV